jgi:hypothetical protein
MDKNNQFVNKYEDKASFDNARMKRNELEDELKTAGDNLYLLEKEYLTALSTFNAAKKLYDSQQEIVKSWYNDLTYTSQRLITNKK